MTHLSSNNTDQAMPADVTQNSATPLNGPWQTDWSREQQMTELRIAHEGSHYYYNGYRYERLPDAIAYAELMKSRPMQIDAGGPHRQRGDKASMVSPNEADVVLMGRLGITFHEGIYYFGAFRYDRLADAIDYANRTQGIVKAPPL